MVSAWSARMPRYSYWHVASVRILLKATEIIRTPDLYVTGARAVDRNGRPVLPRSRRARRWSLIGALSRAALLCNATARDLETAKSEVSFAAIPLGLKGKAEKWAFDDAHAALLWAIERWNYVSTDSLSLCFEAPVAAIRDMILWTMEESRFLRLYGCSRSKQAAI